MRILFRGRGESCIHPFFLNDCTGIVNPIRRVSITRANTICNSGEYKIRPYVYHSKFIIPNCPPHIKTLYTHALNHPSMIHRMANKSIAPIHFIRPGVHTSNAGAQVPFSENDIRELAESYDPALFQAPIVIGHPKLADPAYGWVAAVTADGADAIAEPEQIEAQFAEMVAAGRFKNVSASIYGRNTPGNPKPGSLYLRHIGFLGAQPPAIKGLKQPQVIDMAEDEDGVIMIEFGGYEDEVEAGMRRNLREWILTKFGKDDADAAVASYDVDFMQKEAMQPEKNKADVIAPSFSEPRQAQLPKATESKTKEGDMTPEQLAAQKAELDTQKASQDAKAAEFSEREQKLADREQIAHKASCADFVETQIEAGKVLPAQKDNLIAFMAKLEHVETVDFAEGDATVKKSPLAFMHGYLEAQPKIVEFGEHDAGDESGIDASDPIALAHAAADFVEAEAVKGRSITVTDAVNHIKKSQGGNT